jgi:chitin synthase
LEGRSVKGQVKSTGLVEIAKRRTNIFAVDMTPEEFCKRYSEGFEGGGFSEGDACETVDQARTAFGLGDRDLILGQHKVRFP